LPAHHLAAVAVAGKVFYAGGLLGYPFVVTGALWEYDPATDTFTSRAPMLSGRDRGALGAAVHDGLIYAAGGQRNQEATRLFDVYDPATNRWMPLPDMPHPREHNGAAFIGDRLYVVGGRTSAGTVTATDVFDLSEHRWIPGAAPLPTGRGGLAVAALGGRLYVIGGEVVNESVRPENEVYDPASNRWTRAAPMPTPRHGLEAAVYEGRLWLAGGASAPGLAPVATSEVFTPEPATRSPTAVSALRLVRSRLAVGVPVRIRFRAREATLVTIALQRHVAGRWVRARTRRVRARHGLNTVAIATSGLPRGRYRLAARAKGDPTARAYFRLV
jgi:hypothetical protein